MAGDGLHTSATGAGIMSTVTFEVPWRVHMPTVDATCVRFACARAGDEDPWPLARVLHYMQELGVTRADRPHAVGRGRGVPLIHRQALSWMGCTLLLESHHHATFAADELSMLLPPWDELETSAACEDDLWTLVDTVAAGSGALHGAVGDGEPLELTRPDTAQAVSDSLRRHMALLVSAETLHFADLARACLYRELPVSGLVVLAR